MSDYLSTVLEIAPKTWTPTTYNGSNYATFEITESDNTEEYENVVAIIRSKETDMIDKIKRIERVQHPFAYGRFVLRREQLEKRDEDPHTDTLLVKVPTIVIDEVLKFNLDRRRLGLNALYMHGSSGTCIVIAKCLREGMYCIERDSEIYPEYVVYIK